MQTFIIAHEDDDLEHLLLSAHRYPGVDVPFAVEQIRARRSIRDKLPTWYVDPLMLYPSKAAVEQCSSEQTARYKQRLFRGEDYLCDLTGGLGVDTYYFALKAKQVTYVEQSKDCFEMAMYNFSRLNINHIHGINDEAAHVAGNMQPVDVIYIDPSRRNVLNNRFFALSDCEPDLVKIMPLLLSKAKKVIAKLSPMLDIRHTLALLPETVEVHVVSVKNDCKELLFVCQSIIDNPEPEIRCINYTTSGVEQTFCFHFSTEQAEACTISSAVQAYLYEPNASILKAGGYKQIAIQTGVGKLHQNSHLYTSDKLRRTFPGRVFQVCDVYLFSSKLCKQIHKKIPQAHITTRNFPLSAVELRHRTRIADGGDIYLMATTLANEKRVIIACRKVFRELLKTPKSRLATETKAEFT